MSTVIAPSAMPAPGRVVGAAPGVVGAAAPDGGDHPVDLTRVLLCAVNGGMDVATGDQVGPLARPVRGALEYHDVVGRIDALLDWMDGEAGALARQRLGAAADPERAPGRWGLTGVGQAARWLAAMRRRPVRPVRDATGAIVGCPDTGTDDAEAEVVSAWLVRSCLARRRSRDRTRQ